MEKEVQFPHKLYFTCNGGKNSKIGPKSFRDDFYLQYSLGYSLPFESGTQFTFQIRSKNRIKGLKTSQMTLVVENKLIEFHAI